MRVACRVSHDVRLKVGKVKVRYASQVANTKGLGAFGIGFGVNGALGQGHTKRAEVPCLIQGGQLLEKDRIVQVACGWGHSAVLTHYGDVCIFGRTHDVQQAVRFGRMAQSNSPLLPIFEFTGSTHSIDAKTPQRLLDFVAVGPQRKLKMFEVFEKPNIEKSRPVIKEILCSAGLTGMLSEDSILYLIGANAYGQCAQGHRDMFQYLPRPISGLPDNDNEIAQFSLGFRHCIAVTKKGNVYVWGKGQRGQIGQGRSVVKDLLVATKVENLPGKIKQVTAGFNHCLALTEDGAVYAWGKLQDLDLLHDGTARVVDLFEPKKVTFPEGVNIQRIWSGQNHNVALSSENEFFQWGRLSDRFSSTNSTVQEQMDRYKSASKDPKAEEALQQSILEPVKLRVPGEFSLAKNFSLNLGFDTTILVSDELDAPLYWDWNLNPVPWVLHEPSLEMLPRGTKIKKVSQGWQHTLFVVE